MWKSFRDKKKGVVDGLLHQYLSSYNIFLAREINACIFESAYLARLILSLDVTTQPNHHIIRKQTKIQRHKSLRKRSRPASTHAQIRQAWSCWELERNSKIAQHVQSIPIPSPKTFFFRAAQNYLHHLSIILIQ